MRRLIAIKPHRPHSLASPLRITFRSIVSLDTLQIVVIQFHLSSETSPSVEGASDRLRRILSSVFLGGMTAIDLVASSVLMQLTSGIFELLASTLLVEADFASSSPAVQQLSDSGHLQYLR